ncbi:MAG: hypothetical protein PHE58_03085, partial [Candidatus Omnitrophica bacterium]|nr:hypothetical protein [Candidatus Omnitrophota bacterium]
MKKNFVSAVLVSVFLFFSFTAFVNAQTANPTNKPSGVQWEDYTNTDFGFKMKLPQGWVSRPPRVIEKDVYLELNRSKTSGDQCPAISVMVSLVLDEGEEKSPWGFLVGNTKGLIEDWRSKGAEWKIAEEPKVIKIGSSQGAKMSIDYSTLPLNPGEEVLKNIKMTCYSFYLKDKTKMVTISLYTHGDA